MPGPRGKSTLRPADSGADLHRLDRPLNLVAQVEQLLRQAVAAGRFGSDRLPTEVELAEQLGVSRETVRRAAGVLQQEGLLVKYRRRGTFVQPPRLPSELTASESNLLGYLQADHRTPEDEGAAPQTMSGLLLQGALDEAGNAGLTLVVRRLPRTLTQEAFQQLCQSTRLRGVICASCDDEKFLRRVLALGLPAVLLDHDLHLPRLNSVRDDSFAGARQAVQYLASLGHRRVAFAHWHRDDLNPWRLRGYRQGMRDANLPRRRTWEILTELTKRGARQTVEWWLDLSPRPTALYCFDNTLGRLVVDELRRRGVRVPEDASVVGGGGEEVPGLTCHQADWYRMGRTAVRLLLTAFADPSRHPPEHHLAPHKLHVGTTTAKLH